MTEEAVDLAVARKNRRERRAAASVSEYDDMLAGVVGSERAFFRQGKFLPFGTAYVDSGCAEEKRPRFIIQIDSRDYRPSPEVAAFFKNLKAVGFDVEQTKIHRNYAAQVRREGTPEGQSLGPFASRDISFSEVRTLFDGRENSGFGAYQTSELGFRTARPARWDERGIGFTLICAGYDARRNRYEEHVIDDQGDMAEISAMMSLIAAAKADDDKVIGLRR